MQPIEPYSLGLSSDLLLGASEHFPCAIQVGTPKRGRIKRCSTNQTTRNAINTAHSGISMLPSES